MRLLPNIMWMLLILRPFSIFHNIDNADVSHPDKIRERYENDALKLNKLESFILKLVIPFVRVAHCKRGRYLMVKGNLIMISNDIEH